MRNLLDAPALAELVGRREAAVEKRVVGAAEDQVEHSVDCHEDGSEKPGALAEFQRTIRRPDVNNLEQEEDDEKRGVHAQGSGGLTMGGLIWFSICCATAASALSLSTPFAQHHPST